MNTSLPTVFYTARNRGNTRGRGGRNFGRGGRGHFSGSRFSSSNQVSFSSHKPNTSFNHTDPMQLTCYNCYGVGHTSNHCSSPKLRPNQFSPSQPTVHLATSSKSTSPSS